MRRRFRFRLSTVNRRGDGTGRLQGPRFGGAGGLRAKDGGAFFVVVVVVVEAHVGDDGGVGAREFRVGYCGVVAVVVVGLGGGIVAGVEG